MHRLAILFGVIAIFVFISCEKEAEQPKPTTEQKMPAGVHAVKVIESMNASNYTYINVEENGKAFWIAVPQMEINKGEMLYFSKSMEMKNFKSETLNRTFESVLFVDDVRKMDNSQQMVQHPIPTTAKEEIKVNKLKDGKTIGEIYSGMNKLNGKSVKVRGKVVKYNSGIMGTNWIHIQDGTAFQNEFDLLVTSDTEVQLGQVITAEGKILTNKDFGSGYAYKVLIENAKVKVE
jgi:GW (Gly-Tryp) dipeptide domain